MVFFEDSTAETGKAWGERMKAVCKFNVSSRLRDLMQTWGGGGGGGGAGGAGGGGGGRGGGGGGGGG